MRKTAHYCEGRGARVAFVFSAPGRHEALQGAPVSGMTGTNLDAAIRVLRRARPGLFHSEDRYDYRITNAFAGVLHAGAHGRTEATPKEILEPANRARVLRELSGVGIAVLCGGKPALLRDHLESAGIKTVVVCHCGNRGLIGRFAGHPALKRLAVASDRRVKRAELWAEAILSGLDERRSTP